MDNDDDECGVAVIICKERRYEDEEATLDLIRIKTRQDNDVQKNGAATQFMSVGEAQKRNTFL